MQIVYRESKLNDSLVLVLGTADWNQAIATNQHYMVRELSRSSRVIFVESMGLRRPELTFRDLRRAWSRLFLRKQKQKLRGRALPPNVMVVSPLVVPFHTGFAHWINRILIKFKFSHWKNFSGKNVLLTYSPVTYGLERYAQQSTYHCVDLLGTFPGISSSLIENHERKLAQKGVQAIGSSPNVVDHLVNNGFTDAIYWPNVADVDAIQHGETPLSERREGRAVFAGNLSEKKVDFSILLKLVQSGVELHLAGPIAEGGGGSGELVQELVNNGAVYHGLLNLEDLAKLYWSASVGLIPYRVNQYTLGVNPLKTYEYLAAGLTVVSTAIPAVEPIEGHVIKSTSAEEFVQCVLSASTVSVSDLHLRTAIAQNNSWVKRGVQARRLFLDVEDERGVDPSHA